MWVFVNHVGLCAAPLQLHSDVQLAGGLILVKCCCLLLSPFLYLLSPPPITPHRELQEATPELAARLKACQRLLRAHSTCVWGFGPGLDLLQYTVRAATQRLLQFACCSLPGWVPDMTALLCTLGCGAARAAASARRQHYRSWRGGGRSGRLSA